MIILDKFSTIFLFISEFTQISTEAMLKQEGGDCNHWSKLEVKYYQQDVMSGSDVHENIKQE